MMENLLNIVKFFFKVIDCKKNYLLFEISSCYIDVICNGHFCLPFIFRNGKYVHSLCGSRFESDQWMCLDRYYKIQITLIWFLTDIFANLPFLWIENIPLKSSRILCQIFTNSFTAEYFSFWVTICCYFHKRTRVINSLVIYYYNVSLYVMKGTESTKIIEFSK